MTNVSELRTLAEIAFDEGQTRIWRIMLEAADEIERLRDSLDKAQLHAIEGWNPGIDMEEVKRIRGRQVVVEKIRKPQND
jgi:hypothetical protein